MEWGNQVYVIADASAYELSMTTLEALLAARVLRVATPEEVLLIASDKVPPTLQDELDKLIARKKDLIAVSAPLFIDVAPNVQVREAEVERPAWAGKKPWWQR